MVNYTEYEYQQLETHLQVIGFNYQYLYNEERPADKKFEGSKVCTFSNKMS